MASKALYLLSTLGHNQFIVKYVIDKQNFSSRSLVPMHGITFDNFKILYGLKMYLLNNY